MLNRRWMFVFLIIFIISGFGCASFRKKFIRKSKEKPKEEMVIVPKDYSQLQLPVDQAYAQYYTYWKAWHNELLTHLSGGSSKKKIMSCFEQTILNLGRMKELLESTEKIDLLQGYIDETSKLAEEIESKTLVTISTIRVKSDIDKLLLNIQRYFSISKVRDDLKW